MELVEDDSEKEIRTKLLSSLKGTYSILGLNDFEFVKVTQKKITVLKMAEDAQYNYAVVHENQERVRICFKKSLRVGH